MDSRWLVGRDLSVRLWTNNWLGSPHVERNLEVLIGMPLNTLLGHFQRAYGWHFSQALVNSYMSLSMEINLVVASSRDTQFSCYSVIGDVSTHDAYYSLGSLEYE